MTSPLKISYSSGERIRWTDYRGRDASTAIRITHHKTGPVILHPLEETIIGENGKPERVLFYGGAEAILAKLARRGIPMILHETRDKARDGKPKPTKLYSASGMANWCVGCASLRSCRQPSLSMHAGMVE